mgnify:FL=1
MENKRIETTPRSGPFEGQTVFTSKEGTGIFTKEKNLSILQHLGMGQTPRFRSSSQLAAWIRRNY